MRQNAQVALQPLVTGVIRFFEEARGLIMSELQIENLSMPAAGLGPENPLPPLGVAKEANR